MSLVATLVIPRRTPGQAAVITPGELAKYIHFVLTKKFVTLRDDAFSKGVPTVRAQTDTTLPGLSFLEFGNRSGTPVFYFHGVPGSANEASMASLVAGDNDIRLISPDRLSFLSVANNNRSVLHEWPEKVGALADSLEISHFSIVAFSGGTPYALACAQQLAHRINSVTLVSPMAPFQSDVMQAHINQEFKPLYELCLQDFDAASLQVGQLCDSPENLFALMESALPEPDQRIFKHGSTKQGYIDNLAGAVASGSATLTRDMHTIYSPWGFEPADVNTPVTIWHGRDDANIGVEVAEYMATQFPGPVDLRLLDNRGHFLILDTWNDILSSAINAD